MKLEQARRVYIVQPYGPVPYWRSPDVWDNPTWDLDFVYFVLISELRVPENSPFLNRALVS